MRLLKSFPQTVVLGFSLATFGVANAAKHPVPDPVKLQEHRALLQAYSELRTVISSGTASNQMLRSLHQHHQITGATGRGLRIAGNHEEAIEVNAQGQIVSVAGEKVRVAEPADLIRHKLLDVKTFDETIAKQLLRASGIQGDHANPLVRQRAINELDAKRYAALALVYGAPSTQDGKLLLRHQQGVDVPKGIATQNEVSVVGGELILRLTGLFHQGNNVHVGLSDLTTRGIDSVEKLNSMLGREIVRISGISGDANDPRVLAQARMALETEILEAQNLEKLIRAPAEHSDLALLISSQQAIANRTNKPLEAILAREGNSSIQIGAYVDQFNTFNAIMLVTEGAQPRLATLADLHKFGMATKAEFDAAVGNALLATAKEDL